IFEKKCGSCHSGKEPDSALDLATVITLMVGGESGKTLIAPGKLMESVLWSKITAGEMPPEDEPRLTEAEKKTISDWIKSGHFPSLATIEQARSDLFRSEAQKHWSFRPVSKPTIPTVKNKSWPLSEIDSFILARLETKNLKPAGDADAYTLLRRIYYDLTGLPP
ncbi:MAG: DUF1549 domain-containing protein, partial [Verrucomicrobia bacterium]|nr:DUF1549 domain-containing protein [Verrucomicrobiota bacterium]